MKKLIKQTTEPNTVVSLADDLRQLGIKPDATLLVHTSLSKIGWVNGGAAALVEALFSVVDKEAGTLVVPTHTSDLSEPSKWEDPAVPKSWWPVIRETMPAYDPKTTPCPHMGVVPDLFRTYPDVLRSDHPVVSFAAWGKDAKDIVSDHSLDFGLGEHSPLKKLYDKNAMVLAIGTDYDASTAMHLGEYLAPNAETMEEGAPRIVDGERVWQTFKDIELEEEQFLIIGYQLEEDGRVKIGKIGNAVVKLYPVKDAVDYSARFFTAHRNFTRN
ncbi:MAG: AAC(3) family N-acetyltransferase [Alkalibacterium sp.]|uniref:aminoglycoside N(3)-acetyltransferase n=1 Tax=Alkalibacterium sp. TaxID=1872447 RepID=UPI0039707188